MLNSRAQNGSRFVVFLGVSCASFIMLLASPQLSAASTVNIFDVLVATNNLTVVGTTTVQGNAFSVGGATFAVTDGNILIGTTTERDQFHMVGPLVESTYPEFIWFGSSAALRIGRMVDPGLWDPGNIGHFSMALGSNVFARGRGAFVGGINNYAYADYGAIPGGLDNEVDDQATTVGGGANNIASVQLAVIAGGEFNLAEGNLSAIGGGYSNIVSSDEATVPGGLGNTASGLRSFAAGHSAYAEGIGTFVWADDEGIPLHSTVQNEFKARAGGGFVLLGVPTAPTVILSSGSIIISTSATQSAAVPNIYISSVNGNVGIGTSSPASTLDVNGSAQFGSAAAKSTFTSTGLLQLTASGIQWSDGSTSTTAGASATLPTRQIFTSGSGTYTTPNGARQLRIRMVGGGGGGTGAGTSTAVVGAQGSTTSFNSINAIGGAGGTNTNTGNGSIDGGCSTTAGSGTASYRQIGTCGGGGFYGNSGTSYVSGYGGASVFGGAPRGIIATDGAGKNAPANSGSGGSGANNSVGGVGIKGGGGQAGEYVELIVNSPSASYSYAVGGGGSGGSATDVGGNGGSGVIIVDEYY